MFFLHGETGRLEAVAPLVEATVEQNPGLDAFRAALAFTYAALGRLDDARRQFEILAVDDFGAVSRNILWPNSLALLSEVCSVLGDRRRAEVLLELFRPYSGLLVVYAGGSHSSGAVDRYLGMLETVLGRFADAEAHLESALALEDRVGAPPLLARTRYWHARMLLARDEPGDDARAADVLAASFNTAAALGMAGLTSDIEALKARSPAKRLSRL
jgi:tetratricopeptide (TPR) repeat protein